MVGELAGGAVERGRRVRLGGAPGRAARRVLRHRRAARDVPHRARRVRRLPRRDRPRARPLPAVPRDDEGAHGRRPRGRRPGDRARGDQGARGGGGAGDAGEGPGRERPARPARRRPSASPACSTPARRAARLHRRGKSPGHRRSSNGSTRSSPRIPTPLPPTPPGAQSCDSSLHSGKVRDLYARRRTTCSSSRPTASRSTTSCCRRRSRTRARCSRSCRCGGSSASPTSCPTTSLSATDVPRRVRGPGDALPPSRHAPGRVHRPRLPRRARA